MKPDLPKPESLIMAGLKINFMELGGIKFVDSCNFIPSPLASFPKTFGIQELKKGEFPYKFVQPENYDYVGPLPAREFYEVGRRTAEKKAQCADVALLAAAMTMFEATFKNEHNVVLLEETVTSASAAVKTFRRNFVKEDTIVLDSAPGTGIRQSNLARRYLAYREMKEDLNIATVDTEGEKEIAGHHVDGFIAPCQKYPRGLAIEVHGCYYHAHTCRFAPTAIINGKTATDIRQRDQNIEEELRRHCDVEVVYECEIHFEAKNDPVLKDYLKRNHQYGPHCEREGLFGGRTEPIRLKVDVKDHSGKVLRYKDFTS